MWTVGEAGMWISMAIGLLALWALVALVARSVLGKGRSVEEPDALSVLNQRLARGEITTQEYFRVRQIITTGH